MADVHTPEQRSRNMAAIKGRNTVPEMVVRRLVHGMGYRYRLHRRDLPGRPDLVFSKARKVIFVNGCFWHMHDCRYGAVRPRTNADFWTKKRNSNVKRDKKVREGLKRDGWKILTIWECEVRSVDALRNTLIGFLATGLTPRETS